MSSAVEGTNWDEGYSIYQKNNILFHLLRTAMFDAFSFFLFLFLLKKIKIECIQNDMIHGGLTN